MPDEPEDAMADAMPDAPNAAPGQIPGQPIVLNDDIVLQNIDEACAAFPRGTRAQHIFLQHCVEYVASRFARLAELENPPPRAVRRAKSVKKAVKKTTRRRRR